MSIMRSATMLTICDEIFDKNYRLFSNYNPTLTKLLHECNNEIHIEENDLFIDNELIAEDYFEVLFSTYDAQLDRKRSVNLVRNLSNSPSQTDSTAEQLFERLENSHGIPISSSLPINNIFSENTDYKSEKRDLLLLGSSSLICIANAIDEKKSLLNTTYHPNSITIVESDICQLKLALSISDFYKIVDYCKMYGVKLHLIYNDKSSDLIENIFSYFAFNLPASLYGLICLKSFIPNPVLDIVESWLFSSEGIGYRFLGSLGSSTDEINQLCQGVHNRFNENINASYLSNIESIESKRQGSCILVGSGSSLDKTIKHIKDLGDIPILACGSSIGTLLHHGFRPKYLILVERSEEVAKDVEQLVKQYGDISDIHLICALQIHPTVLQFFKNVSFFHRPLSALSALTYDESTPACLPHAGPESVNAGFEVAALLQFKCVILFGVDLGKEVDNDIERSMHAVGSSARTFDKTCLSNNNTTYLTSDALIASKLSLEAALLLFSDINVFRVGLGAKLNANITEANINDLPGLNHDKSESTQLDQVKEFKSYSKVINARLDNSIIIFDALCLELIELLKSNDHFGQVLFKFCSNIDGISNSSIVNDSLASEAFVKRLFRQVIFSSLGVIYDSTETTKGERIIRLEQSLDVLRSLLLHVCLQLKSSIS